MQVLVVLAERAGQVVTRDELMSRVWNGVFVTDDACTARSANCGDSSTTISERPRVIETIRKRGYRLIAPVTGRDGREGRNGQEGAGSLLRPSRPSCPSRLMPSRPRDRARARRRRVPGRRARRADRGNAPLDGEHRSARALHAADQRAWQRGRPGAVTVGQARLRGARADDGRAHIFTKASADASPLQVTRGELREYAPVWSPDEAQLAFVRRGSDECAIWIAAADGSGARELTPCTATNELKMSWSPDGRLLVAASRGRDDHRIAVAH